MSAIQQLITNHLDIWTSAETEKKSGRGRSSGNGDTVYGIKKLRELILELAVRGKLVRQDPKDEPASELLKRIQAEKTRLGKEGKIKKEKDLPEFGDEDKPFLEPHGWAWSSLGALCILENGDRSKNYPNKNMLVDSGVPFVNAGHLVENRICREEMTFITPDHYDLLRGGKFRDGDILYCLRGSLGKTALVEGFKKGAIASSLVIVRLFSLLDPRYFLYFFGSPLAQFTMKQYDNGTAQPNLSAGDLAKFLVPLPPLAEQHRIVAKVDELMALCDRLETQHNNATDAHEKLVSHLLGTLTQSRDAADFNANWQRIAEHFDTLFTTEHSIDTLKQTLLQLAVMGKLVPQDPNDEPASELLKRIQAEKAKMIAAGKIKKEKPLPPISDEEKPFELPETWEWVRIGAVVESTEYGLGEKTFEASDGVPVLKMGDIQNGKVILGGQKQVPMDVDGLPELYLRKNDLLYNRTNSAELVGKTGIYLGPDKEYTFASYLIRIRCLSEYLRPQYLNAVMNSQRFRETQIEPHLKQQCGQANVNGTIMKTMMVSVPPINEQDQIVVKVEEIMTLCDQLKSRITDSARLKQKLADALVEQALAV